MEKNELEKELKDIHQKLDFISDQMKDYQRRQNEMTELKNDLSLIAKDVFDAAGNSQRSPPAWICRNLNSRQRCRWVAPLA